MEIEHYHGTDSTAHYKILFSLLLNCHWTVLVKKRLKSIYNNFSIYFLKPRKKFSLPMQTGGPETIRK